MPNTRQFMGRAHQFLQRRGASFSMIISSGSSSIWVILLWPPYQRMINQKYERLLSGHPEALPADEVPLFAIHCAGLGLNLDRMLQISLQLHRSSPQNCLLFLSYVDKNELNRATFNDYSHQPAKIQIYNSLTALTIGRAARGEKEDMEKNLIEAKKFLSSSERVRMTVEKSITLVRAHQHFYSGEITNALDYAIKVYQEIKQTGQGKNLMVMTTLSLGQIYFAKRNYQKALEFYKKSLELNHQLPPKARLGMAYCFFYLNKFQLARAAFQRILQLDESSVEAVMGLAVVADREEDYQSYFAHLRCAEQINPKHPLLLLHLAEDALIRSDYLRAAQIAKEGLAQVESTPKFLRCEDNIRNDYEEYKGRFHNIIGQCYHAQGSYPEAAQQYSTVNDRSLIFNTIALAQTHVFSQNYHEAIKILEEVFLLHGAKEVRVLGDSLKLMAYLKSKVPVKQKDEKTAEYYYIEALKHNRNDFQARIEFASILFDINKIQALKQLQEAVKIQEALRQTIKPELLNNIGVLLLEIKDSQGGEQMLRKCMEELQHIQVGNEEDEMRRSGFELTVQFNIGGCLQAQCLFHKALAQYKEVIEKNKYYLDAHLAMAYINFQMGNSAEALKILLAAEASCQQSKMRFLKVERISSMRAYIQFMCGNSSEARDILKHMGKNKDIYTQVFELSIAYESMMRKNVELSVLKGFLRPNRDFCIKYCNEDPSSSFGFMLLAIILLTDQKITKKQGLEFFNSLKQHSVDDLPNVLYNMGMFLMKYDDPQASIATLLLFKEKSKSSRVQELIGLNHLIRGDYKQSLRSVKKSILMDPTNLKHRLQLAYVTERKCDKYYEEKKKDKGEVVANLYQLRKCLAFHAYFSRVNINEYLKGTESSELKERLKSVCQQIKGFCDERKLYAKSHIEYYEKILKDIEHREREDADRKRKESEVLDGAQKELQQLLVESDDEQERQKKQKEIKRKRALEQAKIREQEMNQKWNELAEINKTAEAGKKSRKKGEVSVSKGKKKMREKPPKDQELPSEPSEESPSLSSSPENEQSSEPPDQPKRHRRHEFKEAKEKKKKRLKRAASDDQGLSQLRDDSRHSEIKPEEKEKMEEEEYDLDKYRVD